MRIHTYRNIAKIVLAIYFLFNVCFVFPWDAFAHCGNRTELENKKDAAEVLLQQAIRDLNAVEAEGYMSNIVEGAIVGGIAGSLGGPKGAAFGATVTGSYAAYQYYVRLEQARQRVRDAAAVVDEYEYRLSACESFGEEYTYHCPYCHTYWTFDSYDDYMNFTHNHQ